MADPESIDPGERMVDEEMADEERDRDRCESKTSSATVCQSHMLNWELRYEKYMVEYLIVPVLFYWPPLPY